MSRKEQKSLNGKMVKVIPSYSPLKEGEVRSFPFSLFSFNFPPFKG